MASKWQTQDPNPARLVHALNPPAVVQEKGSKSEYLMVFQS